jgi:hypothetical protein
MSGTDREAGAGGKGRRRGLLSALASTKLAVALIAWIALFGALSTLVPWMGGFFGSPMFLVPAALFVVNLGACSISRFARELRKAGRRRFGPDLLHLGLLLLCVAGGLSFGLRIEDGAYLSEGESVGLPGGGELTLERFARLDYPDGSPREWVSSVRVEGPGSPARAFDIKVNHPLRLGSLALYQASDTEARRVAVADPSGRPVVLAPGRFAAYGKERITYMSDDEEAGEALLRLDRADGSVAAARVGAGEAGGRLGAFEVVSVGTRRVAGLKAVRDPAYPLVMASLIIVALGAAATLLGKAGRIRA